MAYLPLIKKSSANFPRHVNPLKSHDNGTEKLDLFNHEADKNDLSVKDVVTKSDKSEGVVRKLFDAVFSYRKAKGSTCAPKI